MEAGQIYTQTEHLFVCVTVRTLKVMLTSLQHAGCQAAHQSVRKTEYTDSLQSAALSSRVMQREKPSALAKRNQTINNLSAPPPLSLFHTFSSPELVCFSVTVQENHSLLFHPSPSAYSISQGEDEEVGVSKPLPSPASLTNLTLSL